MRASSIRNLLLPAAALLCTASAADTQPSLIYRSEPEYSAEATRARVQSSVTLSIVVGEDGLAHDIKVTKGAGFGLDEKAIEAMDKWRFNPATHDGQPTAVPANIEMNFSIVAKNDTEDRSGQIARLNFRLPMEATRPELIVGKMPPNPGTPGDQALKLHFQVDAQGTPRNVSVVTADDAGWWRSVLRVVQIWRFRPAVAGDRPVAVEGDFEISHSGPSPETVEENTVIPEAGAPERDRSQAPVSAPPLKIPGLIARSGQTATLLGNGTVLVAGGSAAGNEIASAQIFDWAIGGMAVTGNLVTARAKHTATLLRDGTVLIAGGQAKGTTLSSAEIFDPSTGRFSTTGSMHQPHSGHVAALLADGRVLMCGGGTAPAEIYNPASKTFIVANKPIGSVSPVQAVTLKDGKVLLLGETAQLFDAHSGMFAPVGAMTTARSGFSATLLNTGKVLITGGAGAGAEIYDPTSSSFQPTGQMGWPRSKSLAALLPGGKVLVAGDSPQSEIYDPGTGTFSSGPLVPNTQLETLTALDNGTVLATGDGAVLIKVK